MFFVFSEVDNLGQIAANLRFYVFPEEPESDAVMH